MNHENILNKQDETRRSNVTKHCYLGNTPCHPPLSRQMDWFGVAVAIPGMRGAFLQIISTNQLSQITDYTEVAILCHREQLLYQSELVQHRPIV